MAEPPSLTNEQSALCTKLSQLEKVVEYLNFHIEEHYFQIDELQKRYENEEDIMVHDTQDEIELIFSKFCDEKTKIIEKIDLDYKNKINDLRSELNQAQAKITDETKKSIKQISNDLDHYQEKLKRITKEMRKEIAFMQDNSKVDPMNVQKRFREMVERHKLTLDAHDKESQRKQNIFEEQALSSQNDITNKYAKIINDLRRKLRPPPQIRNQIAQSLKILKRDLSNLRNESNKIKNQVKKLSNITFSSKLPEIYEIAEDMKKENEQFVEESEKLKAILQDVIFQIKSEKNILLEKLRSQRAEFSNEISMLEDELACATDPVYLTRKKIKEKEEEIENHIIDIQKQIDEIKDLNSLHEKEKNGLKIEFEKNIKIENEQFEEKKKRVQDQIQNQKVYKEKIKEKENLLLQKKNLSLNHPTVEIGQISIKSEINEVEALFKKEFAKSKIDKKESISRYFVECDFELNRRKDETKDEYEKQMASITNEYKDNLVEKISHQYEELFLSLESQLANAETSDKNEEDSEVELKKRKEEFKAKIDQERSNLIQNYEKLIQEEDQRFHNSPAFIDDTDYTNLLLTEKTKKKEFLLKYDEQIKLLEVDKNKIEATITLDDNLKKLKEESQFQIKSALQQKTDESKSMIAQITSCSGNYSNLIHKESLSLSSVSFQASFDQLNQEKQLNREKIERQINMEKRSFERKSKQIKSTFSKELKKFKSEISLLKKSIKDDENHFSIERQHSQSNFDLRLAQVESDIVSQKPINKPTQLFLELDNQIAQLQRERDRKKRLFIMNNDSKNGVKLMREQERVEIDRLEIELCDKSRQLSQLGKELVIARELSLKGKENNNAEAKIIKDENLLWQRHMVAPTLSMTGKPNGRKQVSSSVEIKRPNMSRTTGQILNLK